MLKKSLTILLLAISSLAFGQSSTVEAPDYAIKANGTIGWWVKGSGRIDAASTLKIYRGSDEWFLHAHAGTQGGNVFLGPYAGNFTMGGANAWNGTASTGVGAYALISQTTGYNNSAFGSRALTSNTTGTTNNAFGAYALQDCTTCSSNVAMGYLALNKTTTSGYNTAVGHAAMQFNTTGSVNTAVGDEALWQNTTGGANTAVGTEASWVSTTASETTTVGYQSLIDLTTANYNSAFGSRALSRVTTGAVNTAVGAFAGRTATEANANVTGSNNVWIGAYSGPGTTTQLDNAIAVGHGALNTASNQAVFGNAYTTQTVLRGNVETPVLVLQNYTYATLPVSPSAGHCVWITDSNVSNFNMTITAGGGSGMGMACHNGTSWTFR